MESTHPVESVNQSPYHARKHGMDFYGQPLRGDSRAIPLFYEFLQLLSICLMPPLCECVHCAFQKFERDSFLITNIKNDPHQPLIIFSMCLITGKAAFDGNQIRISILACEQAVWWNMVVASICLAEREIVLARLRKLHAAIIAGAGRFGLFHGASVIVRPSKVTHAR